MTLVVLVVGAWFSFNGKLTYGELVGFILFVNILIKPVDKISALLELYPKGMAGFRRFLDLIDQEPEIKIVQMRLTVDHLNGDIVFKDVYFNYDSIKRF